MRCGYCHNPDTWEIGIGSKRDVDEIVFDMYSDEGSSRRKNFEIILSNDPKFGSYKSVYSVGNTAVEAAQVLQMLFANTMVAKTGLTSDGEVVERPEEGYQEEQTRDDYDEDDDCEDCDCNCDECECEFCDLRDC